MVGSFHPESLCIPDVARLLGRLTKDSGGSAHTSEPSLPRPLRELRRKVSDPFHNSSVDRLCRSMGTTSLFHWGHRIKKNLVVKAEQKRQAISKPGTPRGASEMPHIILCGRVRASLSGRVSKTEAGPCLATKDKS